jgi:hypothetical protein
MPARESETAGRRRLERLREELLDEALIGSLPRIALDELSYADRPPVHEGRLPPYGAVISNVVLDGARAYSIQAVFDSVRTVAASNDLDALRKYADGYSTFLVRRPLTEDGFAWLGELHSVGYSEVEVVSLAETTNSSVIRRSASGQVSLVVPGRVAWRVGGGWLWKPTARLYLSPVASHVPSSADAQVAELLLDLCVHALSPLGVGATFVWSLRPGGLAKVDHFELSHAVDPLPLSVANLRDHAAIASVAAQYDRAILVNEAGQLTSLGVTLLPAGEPIDSSDRGTRHASAAAFSAGYAYLMVFVVSADGGVTVYQGGREVASTTRAKRRNEDVEFCDCVVEHFTEEMTFPERWDTAEALADPDCRFCDGRGLLFWEQQKPVPFDQIL